MNTKYFIGAGVVSIVTSLLPYVPELAKTGLAIATTVATCVHLARSKRAKAARKPRRPARTAVANHPEAAV